MGIQTLSPTIGNQWEFSNFSAELSNCLQAKVAYLQCRIFHGAYPVFGCQILQEKKVICNAGKLRDTILTNYLDVHGS